jgi:hypothetical protein
MEESPVILALSEDFARTSVALADGCTDRQAGCEHDEKFHTTN